MPVIKSPGSRLLLFFLLFLPNHQAFTQNRLLTIDGSSGNYDISGYTWFYRDCSNSASFSSVSDSPNATNFNPVNKGLIRFGTTSCTFWFRLDVINVSETADWMLDIDYPNLNKVDVYLQGPDGSPVLILQAGIDRPMKDKLVDNALVYAKLNLIPGQTWRIYIRAETSAYFLFPARIRSFESFFQKSIQKHTFIFVLLGILLVSLIVNLIYFILSRDRTYFLLSVVILILILLLFYQYGYNLPFFPELPHFLRSRIRLIISGMLIISVILLSIRYYRINQIRVPGIFYQISLFLGIVYCGLTILPVIPVGVTSTVTPYFSLLIILIFLSSALLAMARKQKMAIYLFLALVTLLSSALIWIMVLNQILPYNIFTYHITLITSTLLIVLANLGLLKGLNTARRAKEKAILLESTNQMLTVEIDERKKTEWALRESEESFRLLFELSPISALVIEFETGIMFMVNDKFCRLSGYGQDELVGKSWFDFGFLPEEQEKVLRTGLSGHLEIHKLETSLRNSRHELMNCLLYATPVHFQGRVRFVMVVNDITLLIRDQEQIRKLSAAIETSPNMVVITNRQAGIEYVNSSFSRITGYACSEVIGENPRMFKGGNLPRSFYEDIWITILKGETWRGEFYNRRKNGELFWSAASITPLLDEAGEIISFISLQEDVTEKKQWIETLKQSEQQLRELNATKDRFFSIIGHDLLDPFNALMGFSNLLDESLQEGNLADAERYSQIMGHSTRRIFDLLQNLLLWTRSQSGQIMYNPMLVNIKDLIDNALSVLLHAALKKEIDIRFEIKKNVKAVLDNNMISTVIRNLVSNSVKFTEKGGSMVISARTDGKELLISISDTGVGMSEEQLDGLFRIDKKISTRDTADQAGTGLGLIICKEFVSLHKGRIWAESTPGKGSTVTFAIPTCL